jgi:hypothetical protein
VIAFGRQVCGNLDASAAHEWLVTDGLGGYAMGTVTDCDVVVAERAPDRCRVGRLSVSPPPSWTTSMSSGVMCPVMPWP